MLKNLLLVTTVLAAVPSVCAAGSVFKSEDGKTTASVGIAVTGLYGDISKENGSFKYKMPGDESSVVIDNSGKLVLNSSIEFNLEHQVDDDVFYGAFVKLNANTSPTSRGKTAVADRAKMYLGSKKFGTLEFGSYDSAYKTLGVGAHAIAVGTGGIDGEFSAWYKSGAYQKLFLNNISSSDVTQTYNDLSGAFYTDAILPGAAARRSNKVTYYTPGFQGLAAGLSFIPDTEVSGTLYKLTQGEILKEGMGYRNVVQAIVKYEGKAGDVGYAFSGAVEFGQAKALKIANGLNVLDVKRNDLRAYSLGASVGVKGLKVAASYGDLGKSGGISEVSGKNHMGLEGNKAAYIMKDEVSTRYYTLGTSYTYDKFAVSLTYLNTHAIGVPLVLEISKPKLQMLQAIDVDGKKNKFDVVSVGVAYDIYENVTTFAEYSYYKYSKESTENVKVNAKGKDGVHLDKGSVVFAGVKVKFQEKIHPFWERFAL